MTIGMAVDSGNDDVKQELAEHLDKAASLAILVGLWVEGRPFDLTLRQVSQQLEESGVKG